MRFWIAFTLLFAQTGLQAADEPSTPPIYQSPENWRDRQIEEHVREVLNADPQIVQSLIDVRIHTLNGVITLRGFVNTAAERDALVKKTASIRGVRSVDNKIEIKPKGNL